ncbi:MAG: carboxylating nicotinate-nucleotide diphosphorylase [Alphaproteobacteria bacterium]|nr:carboxylating nicotinate-nucleotide diphosphorylase [Alphaproteobacteria bacterium]
MQRTFDIQAFLMSALQEDIGSGDITSAVVIPEQASGNYGFRAREDLVVAGSIFVPMLFSLLDERCKVELKVAEGDLIEAGATIATIEGPVRAILAGERVALNILQHLSGIALITRAYVNAVAGTGAKIVDTRKTLPGWRELQKYAVRCGGGHNHRMGLYDAVLIKDNHLAIAGSVEAAVKTAKQNVPFSSRVEVECDTLKQVEEAVAAGADIVLLDNMDNATLSKAVAIAKPKNVMTEASGNVSLETVQAIAKTGVDVISVGRLTHSVRAVDIGLDAA